MSNTEELIGTLTRKQRVLIAQDVIALLRSRQRRINIFRGAYLFVHNLAMLPRAGKLSSKRIAGGCDVCARGALFLASVDRYDKCDLSSADLDGIERGRELNSLVVLRTSREWGCRQAELIEACFEYSAPLASPAQRLALRYKYPRRLLLAICENIIANNGEFKPETSLCGVESRPTGEERR